MIVEDIKLEKLEVHVNKILKKDLYKNKYIECCPHCSDSNFIKYGLYNEIQRYKCKKCNKTFSKTTKSLWSYSKKSASKWIMFTELMLEKKSLRYCAQKLKINLVTAFYWRHKILHGLTLDSIPNKLNGDIHISKTMIIENFKGSRKMKNIKRENIWIIAVKGKEDTMLTSPICKTHWDLKKFNEKIYCKIDKKSYITAYGDRYLEAIAKNHNKKLSKQYTEEEKRIKYIIYNLRTWLDGFYGIATKYLEKYLSWFILYNLDRKINYIDVIYLLCLKNIFISTHNIRLVENIN